MVMEQQNFQRRLFQADLLLLGKTADMTVVWKHDPAAAFTSDSWRACGEGGAMMWRGFSSVD
jgi:hypothetical protein